MKKILSISLVLSILLSLFAVSAYADKDINGNNYPIIFVHGLNGWGDDVLVNDVLPYWGATTGDITEYLAQEGIESYSVSVGAFSSAWDRACEVYACLTGTTVDYGEAHSKEHSHARYGRTYDSALVPDWGKADSNGNIKKIHLVGHSFGGETIRLLTHLLANGAPAEINASGKNASPLFLGHEEELVASVTTIASPHNSTTYYYTLEKLHLVEVYYATTMGLSLITGNTILNKVFDPRLEQFGISNVNGSFGSPKNILNGMKSYILGKDSAVYDLTPTGAISLNEQILINENVYYFSYACSTTGVKKLSDIDIEYPKLKTNPLLFFSSYAMALTSRFIKDKDLDIKYDNSWSANDGLVNTVSQLYPFDEGFVEFDENNINPGIWNVMPILNGDHGTVIGLLADEEQTKEFYLNLAHMLHSTQV